MVAQPTMMKITLHALYIDNLFKPDYIFMYRLVCTELRNLICKDF
jgi:hypothetical protein